MKSNKQLANKLKFRYGTIKLVAQELHITESTARMRIKAGNMEAIRIAIAIDQKKREQEKREAQEILAMVKQLA